jgi:hypothetical protein
MLIMVSHRIKRLKILHCNIHDGLLRPLLWWPIYILSWTIVCHKLTCLQLTESGKGRIEIIFAFRPLAGLAENRWTIWLVFVYCTQGLLECWRVLCSLVLLYQFEASLRTVHRVVLRWWVLLIVIEATVWHFTV